MDFKNKVVLITGASSGIGKQTAIEFAKLGSIIILVARRKNKLEQLRALDNNIKINVALAKSSPIGVDTAEDFMAIKKIMEYKS